ncbi:hypothetical protein [Janthinobacterium lividum]|uniref:Restriction endonuclease type IV Mrr domain-containing protein n=1 Tax=Janthinobacterium lividum TaxID=29581 RepID=A0ABU0XPA0_9BURK|nr:hypothetical protein [Janthinobacterium lividum]MDQ4625018.1 hypothetical protein [Janthinobacterium lividum]MDQ4673379.1 hypothetical protein [Janthinobacterium lividum]MDQ4684109.1 hypothetical protein [Janthinobacterium lividum]
MQNLKVSTWEEWEEISCYIMSELARRIYDVNVRYESYGSKGQSQFGVDLVPVRSNLAVVGQCKLKERAFTWDMALEEIKKTDGYDNPIRLYVILTTAVRHWSVQNQRMRGSYFHTRPDGTSFRVEVRYWEEIEDLNFIPNSELKRIFPEAFRMVEPPPSTAPSNSETIKSIVALKRNVPRWITQDHLNWLENWNFDVGFVYEKDFDPFNDLFFEHNRTVTALNGISEWLHERDRVLIAECLPAGNGFFFALQEFREAIASQITSQENLGQIRLTLEGLDPVFISKVIREWKNCAQDLAIAYRRDVLGQPMNY